MSITKAVPTQAMTATLDSSGLFSQARLHRRRVLLLVYHRDGVASAALQPGTSLTVGRAQPSHIVVQDASLSRQHTRFTLAEDGDVHFEDLGSRNVNSVVSRPSFPPDMCE